MLVKIVASPLESPVWAGYMSGMYSLSPQVSWEAIRSMIPFPAQRVGRTSELLMSGLE